jgi:nitrate/TMAO reductase-like tetraheme cytochrome c subunit
MNEKGGVLLLACLGMLVLPTPRLFAADAATSSAPKPVEQSAATTAASDDDDLLKSALKNFGEPSKQAVEPRKPSSLDKAMPSAEEMHAKVFENDKYPSARKCAECHRQIYEEWSVSNHAYASISPMFHKFEQRINELSCGTVGYFCLRCHASVGTTLSEPRHLAPWEKEPVSNEGITCITCHRVKEAYSKVNGERRIEPGPIYDPVYGNNDGSGVADVTSHPDQWPVRTSPEGKGIDIHRKGIKFDQIEKSEFCLSCHQVAVHPGIKLEVVWDQYRSSPAISQGISCQDCHMGQNPGRADGYAKGPAAVIAGKPYREGQHSNHAMWGPGYPIDHPGIFPQNIKNDRFAFQDWLKFDWRAGWGTQDFEDKLAKGDIKVDFPDIWKSIDDRLSAREVIDENLAKLDAKKEMRKRVMENGSKIDGPFFDQDPAAGKTLVFQYKITNINAGHNLPSGSLGAQPEIWMNVALTAPSGKIVWESGYVDSNGDMCDVHSYDVRSGKMPYDDQLVNLQTKFLTTNVKGTDREMYLPINMDIDQRPFIRPAGVPTTVLNHPPFVRMESRSIPPLTARVAKYRVPADLMTEQGTYKLSARLRSRAEPIYFMKFCGSTPEMERSMMQWMLDIHPYTVEFQVKAP